MFNLTNPFRRADKHGAPDMRPTAPASAEMPMQSPVGFAPTIRPSKWHYDEQGNMVIEAADLSEVSIVSRPIDFHGRETGIARD